MDASTFIIHDDKLVPNMKICILIELKRPHKKFSCTIMHLNQQNWIISNKPSSKMGDQLQDTQERWVKEPLTDRDK